MFLYIFKSIHLYYYYYKLFFCFLDASNKLTSQYSSPLYNFLPFRRRPPRNSASTPQVHTVRCRSTAALPLPATWTASPTPRAPPTKKVTPKPTQCRPLAVTASLRLSRWSVGRGSRGECGAFSWVTCRRKHSNHCCFHPLWCHGFFLVFVFAFF